MEALFGKEQFFISKNAPCSMIRSGDGALLDRSGRPIYTRVSAILIADGILPWNIASNDVCLYHNPWATAPCQGKITQFSQAIAIDGGDINSPEEFIISNKRMEWKTGLHPGTLFNS